MLSEDSVLGTRNRYEGDLLVLRVSAAHTMRSSRDVRAGAEGEDEHTAATRRGDMSHLLPGLRGVLATSSGLHIRRYEAEEVGVASLG